MLLLQINRLWGTNYLLDDLGQFDHAILKYMNPDVDHNGIYDSEEDFLWHFNMQYRVKIPEAKFEIDTGYTDLTLSDIEQEDKAFIIWMGTSDQIPNPIESEQVYIDLTSKVSDYTTHIPFNDSAGIDSEGSIFHFHLNDSIYNNLPELSDLVLTIHGESFFFNNIDFMVPTSDYSIIPLFDSVTDADGIITEIRWVWKEFNEGILKDANPLMVETVIENGSIYFFDYENGFPAIIAYNHSSNDWEFHVDMNPSDIEARGDIFTDNGSIDVSGLNIDLLDIRSIEFHTQDISGTESIIKTF
ncbi:MAG: hypothetical protein JEY99_15650 [Spirochaetales bacterium]|nr:hypothetical protein [Spirochaetales bacterium]